MIYYNIGYVYASQGNYAEAMESYQKALEICTSALGEDHPNTKICQENLDYVKSKLTEQEKRVSCSHTDMKSLPP